MKYLFVKNNITNGWLCFPLFHDVIHDEKLSFFSAGGESLVKKMAGRFR